MYTNSMLAGAGVIAVLMGFIWGIFAHYDKKNETRFVALRKENREAHAGIAENIKEVKADLAESIREAKADLGKRIDDLGKRSG